MTNPATFETTLRRCPDAEPRTRSYDKDERTLDGLVHALGGGAAVIGALMLLRAAMDQSWSEFLPLAVYSCALVTTFAASAAYNLGFDTRYRATLRRLDHSAIFLMIAGTYTPFTLGLGRGVFAIGSTAVIWLLATSGIVLKLCNAHFFERVCVFLYLGLGWASIVILPCLTPRMSFTCGALLALGGLFYSAGVIFHLMERMRFHNAIWHIFVVAGATCHFLAIASTGALAR